MLRSVHRCYLGCWEDGQVESERILFSRCARARNCLGLIALQNLASNAMKPARIDARRYEGASAKTGPKSPQSDWKEQK
jgi:hypothetical protein